MKKLGEVGCVREENVSVKSLEINEELASPASRRCRNPSLRLGEEQKLKTRQGGRQAKSLFDAEKTRRKERTLTLLMGLVVDSDMLESASESRHC